MKYGINYFEKISKHMFLIHNKEKTIFRIIMVATQKLVSVYSILVCYKYLIIIILRLGHIIM